MPMNIVYMEIRFDVIEFIKISFMLFFRWQIHIGFTIVAHTKVREDRNWTATKTIDIHYDKFIWLSELIR